MTGSELAARLLLATIAALIASRFKTREKAKAAFDGMKLTWPQGIALAFGMVGAAVMFGYVAGAALK